MRGTALSYEYRDRTANSSCLAETLGGYGDYLREKAFEPLPYKEPEAPYFLISPMIVLSVEAPIIYLSLDEQRMFQKALRRSVRVVHSARP